MKEVNQMITEEQAHQLVEEAFAVLDHSYSPYSGFQVGAAILTGSGSVYTGVNVENASYGAGICAERSAAVQAVAHGDRDFKAVAIVSRKPGAPQEEQIYAYPCGICRQFLNEFADKDCTVLIARSPKDVQQTTLAALLPSSFGPKDLA